jgi:plastocyanin
MKEHIAMRSNLKKTPLVLPLLSLLLTLGLAACAASGATTSASVASAPPSASAASATSTLPANEVVVSQRKFLPDTRTISAGDHIHVVDDPDTLEVHIVCLGQHTTCDTSAMGPKELTGEGFTIKPGETRDVQFDKAGTYLITCTLHHQMDMVVTVL